MKKTNLLWIILGSIVVFIMYCISVEMRHRREKAGEEDYGKRAFADSIFFSDGGPAKWIKLPHFTTEQMMAIENPKEGSMVFNDDLGVQCFYNGEEWMQLTGELEDLEKDTTLTTTRAACLFFETLGIL